jgi:hypothetical protein
MFPGVQVDQGRAARVSENDCLLLPRCWHWRTMPRAAHTHFLRFVVLSTFAIAACSDDAVSVAPDDAAGDASALDGADDASASEVPEDATVDDTSSDTLVADTSVTPDTLVADTSVTPDAAPDAASDGAITGDDCTTPPALAGKLWYGPLSTAKVYKTGVATLRSCWTEYKPAYELWSDGLVKRRFIYLPAGAQIATGPNPVTGAAPNMDRWVFPVGTRFLKEFARASDGKKVETRIWERTATGYTFGTFVWRADQSDADYTESGGTSVLPLDDGTPHDLPRQNECTRCHDGETGKGLGFSAVQLSKAPASAGDVTLSAVIARGWLSHPPATLPAATGSPIPGTATEAAGMGVLHANCGHCHNPLGQANTLTMELRVRYGETTASTTKLWTTTVGVPTQAYNKNGITLRINPGPAGAGNGVPTMSATWFRYSERNNDQMPPLGTVHVDTTGSLKRLEDWIKGL